LLKSCNLSTELLQGCAASDTTRYLLIFYLVWSEKNTRIKQYKIQCEPDSKARNTSNHSCSKITTSFQYKILLTLKQYHTATKHYNRWHNIVCLLCLNALGKNALSIVDAEIKVLLFCGSK